MLSLPWAIAQLGWIAGPSVMMMFAIVSYYTAVILADCYRTGDPGSGKRNYTYMDSVRSILGNVDSVCQLNEKLKATQGDALSYSRWSSCFRMWFKSVPEFLWANGRLHNRSFHKYDVSSNE